MAATTFRFVHASDFHLEQPPIGFDTIPDPLRDRLIDAPYRAADRVFETAVLENVDFLILSGDIVDVSRAGPRALRYLQEQFQLLDSRGIATYWAGGGVDSPLNWPEGVHLPPSVHWFPADRFETLLHCRFDQPLAALVGTSSEARQPLAIEAVPEAQVPDDHAQLPTIAVAYGSVDGDAFPAGRFCYWALGGRHQRKTLAKTPQLACYCGSPQGRSIQEPGPHGCHLVAVSGDGEVRAAAVACDSIRWRQERLVLGNDRSLDDVLRRMSERIKGLEAKDTGQTTLVCWTVETGQRLARQLARPGVVDSLLQQLRRAHADGDTPSWSVSIDVLLPPELAADRFSEDTILGDYLRAAGRLAENPKQPLGLEALWQQNESPQIRQLLQVADQETRSQLVQEATLLGLELLSGDDAD